ncbi:MAG: hypothetical protein ACTSYM_12810 [Candidatus Baldrarchaeia archaeon]
MKKVYAQYLVKYLIVTLLMAAFSCFTLWLIDSWIKYPLFIFEIMVAITLFLIVNDCDIKSILKNQVKVENLLNDIMVNLMLVFFSLILLIANVLQVSIGLIQLTLSLLSTSLLSGYALLNVLGIRQYFSTLEAIVLSHITSYILTAFLTLIAILLPEIARIYLILSVFIGIGIASMLKHKKSKSYPIRKSLVRPIDALAITLVLAFYVLSFYFLYPGFALLPGTDISRHYAWSVVLWRTPGLYIGSVNLLAHLHESILIQLSNSSIEAIQTGLVALNLMLPLAFYVMAKAYLENIDTRLPSLATLFWVLFTNGYGGFAWLYFTMLKLSTIGQTQLQLLTTTADKTYNGTIYGVVGLWYIPLTIAFTQLIVAIFLLRRIDIPTSKYVAIFSILIAALYLTHVVESVIFALFLAIHACIAKNKNLRIDDALKSAIIGFLLVTLVYYVFSRITPRFIVNTSLLVSIIGPILALSSSLLFRSYIRPTLQSIQKVFKTNKKIFRKVLVLALLLVYIVAFLSWISLVDSFHTWQVDAIGFVPWFMYPLMLGINGLLAIPALYYTIEDTRSYTMLKIFIAFIIFAAVAGRTISIINMNFFDTGYWEKRFVTFIKLSLAMLAPIPVVRLIDKLRKRNMNINLKTVTSIVVIGAIVLCGISTSFLNVEYWSIVTNNPANRPSSSEIEAIKVFKEMLDSDPKTWVVTITDRSFHTVTFAAPADRLVLRQPLYTAYRPEMALTLLYRHPAYNHPYIYLHNRDLTKLSKLTDRFLYKYISMLPLVYQNSEVKIYNVSKLSPPQPNSDNVLILPLDKSLLDEQSLYVAYSILSQGFYNYTVAYDFDDKALDAKNVIVSYDPPQKDVLAGSFYDEFDKTLASYSVIKGKWQIVNGELLAGESKKYGEGIILSQASAENFTASFTFKPISGNFTVPNYVSLVYSWIDPRNYRIADVMFHRDGYIYVHFRIVSDGVEQAIPNWPGIKTNLKWKLGDKYNVTVIVNGRLNQIFINDEPVLSVELDNIPGRVGLRYYRFYLVSFDKFSLIYKVSLNLRPIEDYIKFLKAGGKLIILNTNSYNFFGNRIFILENSTFHAEKIESPQQTLNLPVKITVIKLKLRSSNVSVLSYYVGANYESPFIVKQNYGKGELFYVNIHPIVKMMHNRSWHTFYNTLGKLLEDLKLPKISRITQNLDGFVKEIRLSNGTIIETTSLIFPLKTAVKQLKIQTKSGTVIFSNITRIKIENCSKLLIEAQNLTIGNGQGFYVVLKLNSPFLVKPSTGLLDLEITTEDGLIHAIQAEHFSITLYNSIRLLARTPKVNAHRVTFVEFYPTGFLKWKTRAYGQNLHVIGLTSFQILLSDSYTMLTNVQLGNHFIHEPPLVMFDECSTLPIAIFWTLLLLPVFSGMIFTIKNNIHMDDKSKTFSPKWIKKNHKA